MNSVKNKFAIVSNSLPPELSGSSIVIYKLVKDIPKENYCFIYAGRKASFRKILSTYPEAKLYDVKHDFLLTNRLPRFKSLQIILKFFMQIYYILAFTLGSLIRATQIFRIIKKENIQVIIGCTSDPFNLPATMLAAKMASIPFMAYIFDDYAYQFTGYLRKFSLWIEPIVLKRARYVIVTNEYMEKEYRQRHNIECKIIRNPVELPNLSDINKQIKSDHDKNIVRIVFTGSFYTAHYDAFRTLLKAIDEIESPKIKFYLYSTCNKELFSKVNISTKSIVFNKPVDHSKINHVLRQGSILYLPLAFETPYPELIRSSSPGKTGEYLSIGRPILAHVPKDTFIDKYFRHFKCGAVINNNDTNEMQKLLLKLISDKKWQDELVTNALNRAKYDFNLEIVRKKFIDLINSATKKK